jgi:hypothetical protein
MSSDSKLPEIFKFEDDGFTITNDRTSKLELISYEDLSSSKVIPIKKIARELFDYKSLTYLRFTNPNIYKLWHGGLRNIAIKSAQNMRLDGIAPIADINNNSREMIHDLLTRNELKFDPNKTFKSCESSLCYKPSDMNTCRFSNVDVYDIIPWAMSFYLGISVIKSDGSCIMPRSACIIALGEISNIGSRIYNMFKNESIALINGYIYFIRSKVLYIANEFKLACSYSDLIINKNNSRVGILKYGLLSQPDVVGVRNVNLSCEYYRRMITEFFKKENNGINVDILHQKIWKEMEMGYYDGCIITTFSPGTEKKSYLIPNNHNYKFYVSKVSTSNVKIYLDIIINSYPPNEKWYKQNIMKVLQ